MTSTVISYLFVSSNGGEEFTRGGESHAHHRSLVAVESVEGTPLNQLKYLQQQRQLNYGQISITL